MTASKRVCQCQVISFQTNSTFMELSTLSTTMYSQLFHLRPPTVLANSYLLFVKTIFFLFCQIRPMIKDINVYISIYVCWCVCVCDAQLHSLSHEIVMLIQECINKKALKKPTESVELQQEHFCWTSPPSADNLCTCFFCGCAPATAGDIVICGQVKRTCQRPLLLQAGFLGLAH